MWAERQMYRCAKNIRCCCIIHICE